MVALVALLLAFGGWWFASGQYTSVPSVAGMDRPAAEQAIKNAGLDVSLDGKYSDDVTEDTVTALKPPSGTRISRFGTVTVEYSRGRPVVPQFTPGASIDSVEQQLRDSGLVPKRGPAQFSRDTPQGGVIGLSPTPGTRVSVGSTVTVVASAGNQPVTIPDVRGKSPDDATSILKQAGLSVSETKQQFDSSTEAGKVFGTDPSGQVNKGGSVTLLVSNALTVPDVTGKSAADAQQTLQNAGLVAEVTGDSGSGAVVTSVSPAAGARVDPSNNRVTVTLASTGGGALRDRPERRPGPVGAAGHRAHGEGEQHLLLRQLAGDLAGPERRNARQSGFDGDPHRHSVGRLPSAI